MANPSGHHSSSPPVDPDQSGKSGQSSAEIDRAGDAGDAGDACARAWVAWRGIHAIITEALTDDLGREFGLALTEFEVLTALQPRPTPVRLRLGDLGRYVALSQPAISRLVTRLEHRGLVRRLDGDADRRSVLVESTPAGISLYGRAAPVHAAAVGRHLTGHLTAADQEALVTLITRLHSASQET